MFYPEKLSKYQESMLQHCDNQMFNSYKQYTEFIREVGYGIKEGYLCNSCFICNST